MAHMTILATSGTTPLRQRDEHDDETAVLELRPPRTYEPPPAAVSQVDAALRAFVQNSTARGASGAVEWGGGAKAKESVTPTQPATPEPAPVTPKNDRVLYVGMNDASKQTEADGLRAGGSQVTTVLRRDGTKVRFDGRDFDLANETACTAFVAALGRKYGLSAAAQQAITHELMTLDASARDELARIAMVLAPGEQGAPIPSRLVFSGHSDGNDVHMGGESLKLGAILALARALPNAARQIEDIHFSGCFTSAQIYRVDEWRSACPNLKTMWGYSGLAPGAPVHHLQGWARSTRGRTSSDPVRGPRANVTTWSVQGGIRSGVSLEELRKRQAEADPMFGQLWGGDIESGPWGKARMPYETYRELSHRPELSEQEKSIMKAKADVLLRIRFYETVRTMFVETHGEKVRAAFESLGLPEPDFTRLSRKEALEVLRTFEEKAARTSPLPAAVKNAQAELVGFRKLDPAHIPDGWCH